MNIIIVNRYAEFESDRCTKIVGWLLLVFQRIRVMHIFETMRGKFETDWSGRRWPTAYILRYLLICAGRS